MRIKYSATVKLLLVIAISISYFQNINAQWKYNTATNIKEEVIINYEVVFDKEPTGIQKKAENYYDNIVVIFNGNKLKEQIIYNNLTINSFVILDYDKEKLFRCNQSSKYGISYDFKTPKLKVTIGSNTQKTILDFECNKAVVKVKGLQKPIYYTKKLGLRYCKQFDLDGFILEYPGYSKSLGHYRVVAKTIHYKKLPPSIFALDDYKIYTSEEYKTLKNKSTERYAKARFENVGLPIKKFNMRSMKGKKLSSKNMADEIIVLNFWFTTCPPCKKEIPQLNKLKKAYKGKKVNFIAIATDPEYKLDAFLKNNKFDYDIVSDGRWLTDKYDITSYPTNIVIDKKGVIQLFEIGYKSDILKRMTYQIEKAIGNENIDKTSSIDTFVLESPYAFINDKIKLTISDTYKNVTVESSNTDIEIERFKKNTFYISSKNAVSDAITLKLTKGKNVETKNLEIHFYNHGTEDLETVEGIKLEDSSEKISKLLGKPNKVNKGDKVDNWYYQDGELSFDINKTTKNVMRINIFGFLKSYHSDNNNTINFNKYKYNISGLGNFNDSNGIIMDTVVKKYGIPNIKKFNEGSKVEWYTYFLKDKKLIFHFSSKDINDYYNKKVTFIGISTLSKKDRERI